jgi:hypothetical protein
MSACTVVSYSSANCLNCFDTAGSKYPAMTFLPLREGGTAEACALAGIAAGGDAAAIASAWRIELGPAIVMPSAPNCKHYQSALAAKEHQLTHCRGCGQPIAGKSKRFLIPRFGFITGNDGPQSPGDTPPERTYTTRTFFSGESKPRAKTALQFATGKLIAESASEASWLLSTTPAVKALPFAIAVDIPYWAGTRFHPPIRRPGAENVTGH